MTVETVTEITIPAEALVDSEFVPVPTPAAEFVPPPAPSVAEVEFVPVPTVPNDVKTTRDVGEQLNAEVNRLVATPAQKRKVAAAQAAADAAALKAQPTPKIVLKFPLYLKLTGDHEGKSGQYGNTVFENGISVHDVSWRRAMNLAVAYNCVADAKTGLDLDPCREGRDYLVDSLSKTWREGLPRLGEAPDAPVRKVVEGEVTKAPSPELKPSDAVTAASIKALLEKALTTKGARYVRQLCETRGVKTARSGEDMVQRLIEHGFTIEEARGL